MGCRGVAVLPEGMSRERFAWLEAWVADPRTSSARPAPRATSRRSTTGATSSRRDPDNVIFNQFAEFGNHIVHYVATGRALETRVRVAASQPARPAAARLRVGDRLGRDDRRRRLSEGALRVADRRLRGARVPDDALQRLRRAQHPGDRRQAHPADPQRAQHRRRASRSPTARPTVSACSSTDVGRAYLARTARRRRSRSSGALPLARPVQHLQRARRDQDRQALRPRAPTTSSSPWPPTAPRCTAASASSRWRKHFPDGFDEVARRRDVRRAPARRGDRRPARADATEERERIFNLGYFTWVEQQGISHRGLRGAARAGLLARDPRQVVGDWDELIDEFNAAPASLEPPCERALRCSRLVCAGCGAEPGPTSPIRSAARTPAATTSTTSSAASSTSHGVRFPARGEPSRTRSSATGSSSTPTTSPRPADLATPTSATSCSGSTTGSRPSTVTASPATPFARSDELSDAARLLDRGGVWVKDETGNVSGSHKARHLFGVLVHLEVLERLGSSDRRPARPRDRELRQRRARGRRRRRGRRPARSDVFVPVDAEPAVVERLEELGAADHRLPARDGRGRRPDRTPRCSRRSPGARCRSPARAT